MRAYTIHISQFLKYVFAALHGDEEIVQFFDKEAGATTVSACCISIYEKIQSIYPTATIKGVVEDSEIVGFFVFERDLLISFAVNKKFRDKKNLTLFWELIKQEFHGPFQSVLYSHNTRAINWLQKAGMKILLQNITILSLCQQEV